VHIPAAFRSTELNDVQLVQATSSTTAFPVLAAVVSSV